MKTDTARSFADLSSRILLLALAVLISPSTRADATVIVYASSTGSNPPGQYSPGSSVTFEFQKLNSQEGQFQWLHNDFPIPAATGPTLTLTGLTSLESGNYRLQVTHGLTSEFSETFTLNVAQPPPIPVDVSFRSSLPGSLGTSIRQFTKDGAALVSVYNSPTLLSVGIDGSASPTALPATTEILDTLVDGRVLVSVFPYLLLPDGSASPFVLPAGFDSTQRIRGAALDHDPRFLVAQGTRLVRLNANSSLDSSFNYAQPANDRDIILEIKVDSRGRVYVTRINDEKYPMMLRLLQDGTEDPSFTREHARTWGSANRNLFAHPLNDGRVLIEGVDKDGFYFTMHRATGESDPSWQWNGSLYLFRQPIVDPAGHVYFQTMGNGLRRATLTATGIVEDRMIVPESGYVWNYAMAPSGDLLIAGNFISVNGYPTSGLARLRTHEDYSAPVVTISSSEPKPSNGSPFTLRAHVSGTGPLNFEWLALDDQPLPALTTSDTLSIPAFKTAHIGRYQLRATGPGGVTSLSQVIEPFADGLPYLANLSGRAHTGPGDEAVIAGVVTRISSENKGVPMLIRGSGPALKALGVHDYLPNPAIDIFNSDGAITANNDQWSVDPGVTGASAAVGAFAFEPGSNDAALLPIFPYGTLSSPVTTAASIKLRQQSHGDGVGLLEIYQVPSTDGYFHSQSLLNLSLRARTAPGENTAIAGFVIADPDGFERSARVLIRAIGPTLAASGLALPLQNPVLTVYNSKGEIVAQNDDWAVNNSSADTATLVAAMKHTGAFELSPQSRDAALLLNLPAGAYSMHATGGTGVVLLEIYRVE